MIDRQIIDKIMTATRIEEVIGSFIPLRKRGENYIGICPFHKGIVPSFYVSPGKGIYKCFSCGKGGDVISFLKEYKGFSYLEAIQWLSEKCAIPLNDEKIDNNHFAGSNIPEIHTIAFIDTEVSVETQKVKDYGAVLYNGEVLHTNSHPEFVNFVSKCDILCGHNIIKHDLGHLNLQGNYSIIDTLPLSPLLFPKKPYHRLLKDDKLQVDELNNPVNDAKKARDLFYDEVAAWNQLSKSRQEIFRRLLSDVLEFKGFVKCVTDNSSSQTAHDIGALIKTEYRGLLCESANIEAVAKRYPVELAYALALIGTDDLLSITPAWVMHSYPKVGNVMTFLRNTPCGECEYCKQRLDAHSGLKEFFGYDEFRHFDGVPMQQLAVEAAIRGESLLTIFPTGGGKSLTFQLPALMAGRNVHGLTVVISPLQSLMKDQVDNLSVLLLSMAC